MTALFDSHAHLADAAFADDLDQLLERARAAGVHGGMMIGADLATSARAVELSRAAPGWFAAVGVHPHDCGAFAQAAGAAQALDELRALARDPQVRAIGETGLDFHHAHQPAAVQERAFRAHCRLAADLQLPLVVHQRNSLADVERVLAQELGAAGGVMHSFTGSADDARRFAALGLHVSISGIVTFARADDVRAMAAAVPAARLLVETDAPYLAPAPRRGRRNEPAYLPHTLAVLAALRGVSISSLQALTVHNAQSLFRCAPIP